MKVNVTKEREREEIRKKKDIDRVEIEKAQPRVNKNALKVSLATSNFLFLGMQCSRFLGLNFVFIYMYL